MAENQLNKRRIQGSSFNIGEGQSTSGKIFATLILSGFLCIGLLGFSSLAKDFYADCIPYFWDEAPCRIISSKISKPKNKSDDKKFEVAYAYRYKDRGYTGERLMISVRYLDDKELRHFLRKYKEGLETKCYVNPNRSDEAVLRREIDWLMLLPIIVTSVFMLIGGLGIFFLWRKPRYRIDRASVLASEIKQSRRKHIFQHDPADGINTGAENNEVVLKNGSLKFYHFIGIFFFVFLWNAVLLTFFMEVLKTWLSGNPQWILTIFVIPFVFAGLTLLVTAIYMFIGLFNPKVTITVSNPKPELGEKVVVGWKISRSASVKNLEILLKGGENILPQNSDRGNNQNRQNTFELLTVLNTTNPEAIHGGKAQFTVPADKMHSLDGKNARINWKIVVSGEVKYLPALNLDYPIIVMPLSRMRD